MLSCKNLHREKCERCLKAKNAYNMTEIGARVCCVNGRNYVNYEQNLRTELIRKLVERSELKKMLRLAA